MIAVRKTPEMGLHFQAQQMRFVVAMLHAQPGRTEASWGTTETAPAASFLTV